MKQPEIHDEILQIVVKDNFGSTKDRRSRERLPTTIGHVDSDRHKGLVGSRRQGQTINVDGHASPDRPDGLITEENKSRQESSVRSGLFLTLRTEATRQNSSMPR
jgi:hypothetical protein